MFKYPYPMGGRGELLGTGHRGEPGQAGIRVTRRAPGLEVGAPRRIGWIQVVKQYGIHGRNAGPAHENHQGEDVQQDPDAGMHGSNL